MSTGSNRDGDGDRIPPHELPFPASLSPLPPRYIRSGKGSVFVPVRCFRKVSAAAGAHLRVVFAACRRRFEFVRPLTSQIFFAPRAAQDTVYSQHALVVVCAFTVSIPAFSEDPYDAW